MGPSTSDRLLQREKPAATWARMARLDAASSGAGDTGRVAGHHSCPLRLDLCFCGVDANALVETASWRYSQQHCGTGFQSFHKRVSRYAHSPGCAALEALANDKGKTTFHSLFIIAGSFVTSRANPEHDPHTINSSSTIVSSSRCFVNNHFARRHLDFGNNRR